MVKQIDNKNVLLKHKPSIEFTNKEKMKEKII